MFKIIFRDLRVKNANESSHTNHISVLSVVGNIFNLIYLYAWLIIQMRHHWQISKWNAKKWPQKPLILGKSGTHMLPW